MSWFETECKKCAIGETECNEIEVFILRRLRIDLKRKRVGEREKRENKINTSCFIQIVYLAMRH